MVPSRHQGGTMHAHDDLAVDRPDFLLAVLERTNDAVVILDHDHHVSHFNAAAELIWGVYRAEIIGHPADRLGLDDLHRTGTSEMTIRRSDGSRIRIAASLSQVVSGGRRRTIAIVRDITPELELRERLALHELIADGTNRAVIIVDRHMRIVYANATFEGIFGHTIAEAQGRQAGELLAGR